jgi:hypothetical protein
VNLIIQPNRAEYSDGRDFLENHDGSGSFLVALDIYVDHSTLN